MLLLCFLLNAEAKAMPRSFVDAWKAWIKFSSSFNAVTGRYELPHHQGFVVVKRPQGERDNRENSGRALFFCEV